MTIEVYRRQLEKDHKETLNSSIVQLRSMKRRKLSSLRDNFQPHTAAIAIAKAEMLPYRLPFFLSFDACFIRRDLSLAVMSKSSFKSW